MDISRLYAKFLQIVIQLLGHTLGESGYKHTLIALNAKLYLLHQIINLIERGTHLNNRVKKTRGTDNLLHDNTLTALQLIIGGSGTHIHDLRCETLKFLKLKRTVVKSCRQPESVFNEIHFARQVAAIHGTYLRNGDMALVNYSKEIFGEIIKETEWAHAGTTTVKIPAIVFNTRTVAHLAHHLNIISHTLLKSLSLQQTRLIVKELHLLAQVQLNLRNTGCHALTRGYKYIGREYLEGIVLTESGIVGGIVCGDRFNLIAPEYHAHHNLLISQIYVNRVAFDAEVTACESYFVARVQSIDKLTQKNIACDALTGVNGNDIAIEILGIAHAIKT